MRKARRFSPPSEGSDRAPGSERGLLPSLGVFTNAGFALVISLRFGSSGRSTCGLNQQCSDTSSALFISPDPQRFPAIVVNSYCTVAAWSIAEQRLMDIRCTTAAKNT